MFKLISSFVLLLITTGCVTPKSGTTPQSSAKDLHPKASKPQNQAYAGQADEKSEDCLPFSPNVKTLPYFVPEFSVVVTGVLRGCKTSNGSPGYQKGSGWTAMGFPCTAGGGRLDWNGSQNAPKLVMFEISNSCPMIPQDPQMVAKLVAPKLGFGPESKLLAYYPFAISYWELADGTDADTSYTIEVVTAGARQQRWVDYAAGKPIKVRLYGRQNSLMPSQEWYQVEADLLKQGEETFKIAVTNVISLNEEQLVKLKQRCQTLSPSRKCGSTFP